VFYAHYRPVKALIFCVFLFFFGASQSRHLDFLRLKFGVFDCQKSWRHFICVLFVVSLVSVEESLLGICGLPPLSVCLRHHASTMPPQGTGRDRLERFIVVGLPLIWRLGVAKCHAFCQVQPVLGFTSLSKQYASRLPSTGILF